MRILWERRAVTGARIDRMVVALAALSAAASLALPAAAAAEGLTVPADVRTNMSTRLDVKLSGRIDSRCLLNGGGEINLGELRGGQGAKANFGLDCNVPFNVDVTSARGGLAHAAMPAGEGPFSGLLEYDVRLTVPTLRPAAAVAQASFSSRQLLGKRTLSSGDGISAGGGQIEVRTRQPAGAGLLAGQYSETLTISISPQM